MAIITEEKLAERLNSEANVVNILKLHNQGRKPEGLNRSTELRAMAGFLAHFETAKEVGKNLGMSPSMVHHYKHGRNGTGLPNSELSDSIQGKLGKAKDIALEKMLGCLGEITGEKIKELKPVAASTVAKNMASIIEKTSEKAGVNAIQFNIYAPGIKDESSFEVIEVER